MKPRNFQLRKASKMLLTAAAFLSFSTLAFGQTNIAVAPSKMNVLYIGVDNPVTVAANGANEEKLTVTISGGGGTITKTGSGCYNVRVAEPTDECLLHVYVDGKLAGTSAFRVRSLPAPAATVGGFHSGANVDAAAFRNQAGLGVYVKDFPFEVQYEVQGFSLNVADENGNVQTVACQGAAFSAGARQLIVQNVKAGRTVTVDKILAKDPGGRELKLPSLVYFIK